MVEDDTDEEAGDVGDDGVDEGQTDAVDDGPGGDTGDADTDAGGDAAETDTAESDDTAEPGDATETGGASDGGSTESDDGGADRDSPAPNEQYCASCGEIIKKKAEICPHCGVRNRVGGGSSRKDRTTAGVLAILLGWVGAHKFYLGETGLGILYLCFFWTTIPGLVGLIEGILYLTKTDEEFERRYVH